ncbi:MAG: hypothetical protein N6V49_00500 [Serratia symbiotica]|nr:hypothetical protein [Serratia symbiotica]
MRTLFFQLGDPLVIEEQPVIQASFDILRTKARITSESKRRSNPILGDVKETVAAHH